MGPVWKVLQNWEVLLKVTLVDCWLFFHFLSGRAEAAGESCIGHETRLPCNSGIKRGRREDSKVSSKEHRGSWIAPCACHLFCAKTSF